MKKYTMVTSPVYSPDLPPLGTGVSTDLIFGTGALVPGAGLDLPIRPPPDFLFGEGGGYFVI